MTDPFVGEIRMFGGNFAPRSWAFCDGQLLAITQNEALFSLLGTIYGGDGRTTFGLPDLRGRVPVHMGQGPGLSNRPIGSRGGSEVAVVSGSQVPVHSHQLQGTSAAASTDDPTGARFAVGASEKYHPGIDVGMMPNALDPSGGGQSHENVAPSLAVNFIIALYGIYPSRH